MNTPPAPPVARVLAIDRMRGLVMALMAVDHCDAAFNPRHAQGDSVFWRQPYPLPTADFLTRWCTHLCAPTFVFLAGTSVALAAARGAGAFDRHLLLRGLVLVLLEVTLVSSYWRAGAGGPVFAPVPVFLQVLFALGTGLAALAALRHLRSRAVLAVAAALLLGCEALQLWHLTGRVDSVPLAVLVTGGVFALGGEAGSGGGFPDLFVLYPALPWLPAMLLGLLLGRRIAAGADPRRTLVVAGTASLAVFAVVRGLDGAGNMGLHRRGPGVLEWLHCSKYPPSVAFLAMELGIMALLLAALFAVPRREPRPPSRNGPLLVLGQVPLFFYLLHLPVIGVLGALGVFAPADHGAGPSRAGTSWLAALVVVLLLWPLCAWYRGYKLAHRHRWTRYL